MEKGSANEDDNKGEAKARKPRRMRNEEEPAQQKNDSINVDVASKPRRKRVTDTTENEQEGDGGWFGGNSEKKTIKPEQLDDEPPIVTATQNKDKHFSEDVSDIIIPDLDENGGEDQRVVQAPRNLSRKLPTLSQLQNDSVGTVHANKEGIDLNVLLDTLVPPEMLIEDDNLWVFESLLRGITEELNVPKKVEKVLN